MRINRIWFSGIRTLNTPNERTPEKFEIKNILKLLHQTDPLLPGQVNIIIGDNGSGKSTIIDMIRALRHPEILASLPRENPPLPTCPAYSIEFTDGTVWSTLFPTTSMDGHDAISYVGCHQEINLPNAIKILGRGELYKAAPTTPFPSLATLSNICYRNGPQPEDSFGELFIKELNSIRHALTGLAANPRDDFTARLKRDGAFEASGENLIGVLLDDDHIMHNTLHGHWLPSGWKTFAWIISWLKNCPEGAVCLLEEPETHLHPTLMRFLLETLIKISTDRKQQLFISTHSASLINVASKDKLTIFQSYGTHIECKPDLSDILDRLGYMASDILLSNCIIWVEGPSDRLYLNHWINGADPDLVEGSHYSIMFYGGRLLSHLTGDDDQDLSDLINLKKLNRHCAIVLDSDKSGPKKSISKTKARIIKEFSKEKGSFTWLTEGREIENYLDINNLESAIKSVHPSALKIAKKDVWSNLLQYKKPWSRKGIPANKVKVASRYVSDYSPDYSVLDLKQRMEELCQFIRRRNAMTHHTS